MTVLKSKVPLPRESVLSPPTTLYLEIDKLGLSHSRESNEFDVALSGGVHLQPGFDTWECNGGRFLVSLANMVPYRFTVPLLKLIALFDIHYPAMVNDKLFLEREFITGFCREKSDQIRASLIDYHESKWSSRANTREFFRNKGHVAVHESFASDIAKFCP